jgi:hypothetical protein
MPYNAVKDTGQAVYSQKHPDIPNLRGDIQFFAFIFNNHKSRHEIIGKRKG